MAKTLYKGRYLTLLDEEGWEYVHRHSSFGIAVIVAVHEGKLLLVEEYRRPVGAQVIALPAGLVDRKSDDRQKDLEYTAHKELLEETGYSAGSMRFLVSGVVSPGQSSETLSIFRAEGLVRKYEKPPGDGDEKITLHEVPLDGIFSWLEDRQKAGVLIDLKVYLGLGLIGIVPPPGPG